tara:strand:+ start:156 stop:590 length:435 start_codon:yes stop_codon:yes gene_type:complete
LDAQLLVPNTDAVIPPNTFTDPVILSPLPLINNDPVITALPENGNPEPPAFSAKLAVVANDDDVAILDVDAYEAEVTEPNNVCAVIAKLDVVVKEADTAFCAQLLVPNNDPVRDVAVNEPTLVISNPPKLILPANVRVPSVRKY